MRTTDVYTIERVTPEMIQNDEDLRAFMVVVGREVASLYGDKFNWRNFRPARYASRHRFVVCKRDGVIVGVHLSRLAESGFDPDVCIAIQDLIWCAPRTRAAYWLLRDFIDFGKANANHVITMLTPYTNIKPASLERLGFQKLETLYRLEC